MTDSRPVWASGHNFSIRGFFAHLIVVTVLSFIFLAVSWKATVDANIGAGLLALPLFVLGFPWSVLSYLVTDTDHGWQLSLFGAALLNVIIHGGALLRRRSA